MKSGKEEKIMGPMFPRLHVNDTDKGGPRAPPRNKMALYEQLSVPSNRFTHPAASLVHPSSQGNANEKGMFSSYHMPNHLQSEKQYAQYPDSCAQLTQIEQRKKLKNDVFAVPTFVHSVPNQEHCEYTNQLREWQKFGKTGIPVNSLKQEAKSHSQANLEKLTADQVNPFSILSVVKKAEVLKKKIDSSGKSNTNSSVKYNYDSKRGNHSVLEAKIVALDTKSNSTSVMDFSSEDQNILHDISNETEFQDRPCRSQQMKKIARVDSLTEHSVVDSISRLDITPDDMVGIIGQKHFWKARREIVNQRRIFAIQVFELHRLIKVQRLIAASPHILLEDSTYFTKPIKASSPVKRKPLNNPLKENPHIPNTKGGPPEKPVSKTKTAIENATHKKASSASVHNRLQPPIFNTVSGDYSSGPCGFSPQPLGNQWLVPVISPSEGLVYKPYLGLGFSAPAYGRCGPPGSSPVMGNFLNPVHGNPALQFPSFPSVGPHGYTSPFWMPVTNGPALSIRTPKEMTGPSFSGQISAGDMPGHLKQDGRNVLANLSVPNDVEVQVSTASSPVENNGGNNSVEERNVLPLFPTSPATSGPKSGPPPPEPEGPTQVIKVVPHNARSASESAARIFLAIQERRRHDDYS